MARRASTAAARRTRSESPRARPRREVAMGQVGAVHRDIRDLPDQRSRIAIASSEPSRASADRPRRRRMTEGCCDSAGHVGHGGREPSRLSAASFWQDRQRQAGTRSPPLTACPSPPAGCRGCCGPIAKRLAELG